MKPAQINWNPLPVKGVGGLIFAVGLLVLISVALPEVPKLLLPAVLIGVVAGLTVYFWRNRSKRQLP